ncbi:MAG: DUF6600 domain-containing protein [Chitinophagaceae bacterium]
MKRILSILALSVSLVLTASVKNPTSAQVGVGVQISYQDFYDELSPHGRWMDYPDYGYVWMPNVGADFRPYGTNGRWVWSDDYEWMWASDYSWGWAPFHYGRWFMDPMYGWMWVPGYDWSPAWVAWRDGGDYYGWAPIQPGFSFGINFNIGNYNPPVDYWCFTPRRYISSARIYNHFIPSRQNVTIINNTTIINNYNRRTTNNIFVNGPRRGDAERYAGRIKPVRFREVNTPGRTRVRNNEVSFYRPSIRRDNDRTTAPRNFDRYNNRNGQNDGNGRMGGNGNNGTGWRQTNDRNNNANNNGGTGWNQANERRRDNNNTNERVNTTPDRTSEDRNTGWRQMNDRRNNDANNSDNNSNRERPAATPERTNENRNTGWRQRNGDNNNNNNNADRPNMFNRQPRETVERPSVPVERNDRNRQQVDRQPERRVFERRENNNDAQRRINVERPARQSMPQMNREQQRPQPQRQMETRQGSDRRGGGNEGQRGGGRRRD